LAAINLNRVYKSEIDVLISPKNSEIGKNLSQIAINAGQLPLTLSFYDKLLKDNPQIHDRVSGLSERERKNYWNSEIQTEKLGNSTVIRITVVDKDSALSKTIAQLSALGLAQDLSKFYNIKTDIDVRIIDGPVTGPTVRYNYFLLLALSLALSLVVTFISFIFSSWVEKISFQVKPIKIFSKSLSTYSLKPEATSKLKLDKSALVEFNKAKLEKLLSEEEAISQSQKGIYPADFGKKATPPSNLPVSGETIFSNSTPAEEKEDKIKREPTPEEVKERLNKLLSGEL
jgi:capsular polysaccharide biosynthesis protein